MYQIVVVLMIIIVAGLIGGWAGYLTDPISSGNEPDTAKKHACKRYLVLGLVAAGSVPLFLSVLQSNLVTTIFTPKKDGTADIVPFAEFLIFAGFCLIAAVSARAFLDSMTRRLMKDIDEMKEVVADAAQQAQKASVKADDAQQKAEIATELADDAAGSGHAPAAAIESARRLAAGTTIPDLQPDQRRALQVLMRSEFRTASGLATDIGMSRNRVGEFLDGLASKGVAEHTKSPATGGRRWRITPLGVQALQGDPLGDESNEPADQ